MNRVCLLAFALALGGSAASAGTALNGLTVNGLTVNGLTVNGLTVNGLTVNGLTVNGTGLNPSSGMPPKADSSDAASPLVVQALTLADGRLLTVVPGH